MKPWASEKPEFLLEGAPTSDQKNRLEDWLTQLKILCRTYNIVLDTEDGETRLIDLPSGRVIGIGLSYLVTERGGRTRITGYDVADSILDGVWPVDTAMGPVDQRSLGSHWPSHPYKEEP